MEGKALDSVGTRHLDRSHCPALLPHSIFQLECFLMDKKGARAGGEPWSVGVHCGQVAGVASRLEMPGLYSVKGGPRAGYIRAGSAGPWPFTVRGLETRPRLYYSLQNYQFPSDKGAQISLF